MIKKYWFIILIALAFILYFVLRKYLSLPEENKLLNYLDNKDIALKDKIEIINNRVEKRKILYKAVKDKKFETDKSISSMSDNDLDVYIKRYL